MALHKSMVDNQLIFDQPDARSIPGYSTGVILLIDAINGTRKRYAITGTLRMP